MGIYRTVNLSFWTDSKVIDDFTPEDKYFYLYLLTNPHTNICGCYEISIKQMSRDTGYIEDTIERLLTRMDCIHDVCRYDKSTKEIIIWNWHKYNWTLSKDLIRGAKSVAENIKNASYKSYVLEVIENYENGEKNKTVYRPSIDGVGTSVTVTDTNTNTVFNKDTERISNNKLEIKEIIDYLNIVLGTHYRYTTKDTVKHIKARLSEGFTVDDFKMVIDKKARSWKDNPQMATFLRPETLFGNKFENYLNEIVIEQNTKKGIDWDRV